MVEHVEVLVEEPSMEAALRILIPRLIGDISFEIYPFQGKMDLLDKLHERLMGYKAWLPSTWRIVVIVDRDSDDCRELKSRLEAICQDAGVATRTARLKGKYFVVNRLAIEELEAWYFGDWDAVCNVYPRVSKTIPNKQQYRDPDAIRGGTWEAFERILKRAGYFQNGLRKIEVARAVANEWSVERNRSRSFQQLCKILKEFTDATS